MSETAVWLLDVDGVINALGDRDGLTTFRADGFSIAYNPDIWKRVIDLHMSGKVEIRWLSTWNYHDVNANIGKPLGWPELVVEDGGDRHGMLSWWKLPVAQRVHAEGKPIVWADDDITSDRPAIGWCATNPETVFGVAPDLEVGLTIEQLDAIETWMDSR